ncbi:DUF2905 domain-containing protein [Methyloceanibacter sp.]|uniref:DUF2905 domain-containing protein n=1 Tax=Methyloceanibacter sp. TaxID=1965321 RepID=UPI00351ACE5D
MKPLGASLVFLLAVVALTFLSVRYGLGRLPGDLIIDRGGVVIYLPITTAVIVSVILSAVVWLFRR